MFFLFLFFFRYLCFIIAIFLTFYCSVRTCTPFHTLGVLQVNRACKRIVYTAPAITVMNVAKSTKTVIIYNREAEPTLNMDLETRQSTCAITPDLLRLRFDFTEHTSFCKFYRAWWIMRSLGLVGGSWAEISITSQDK